MALRSETICFAAVDGIGAITAPLKRIAIRLRAKRGPDVPGVDDFDRRRPQRRRPITRLRLESLMAGPLTDLITN